MPDQRDAAPPDPYAGLAAIEDGPLSRSRRTIAQRLGAAMAEAIPVTLMRPMGIRHARPYDGLIVALVAALKSNPRFNATFEDGRFRSFRQVNLGVAFDGPQGLVVPVIEDAGNLGPDELKSARSELASRVRSRTLTMTDLLGGTFTVSNLGAFGIEYFTPIINPPQVAILGVGRATARDGQWSLPLSLTFDHRVNDGVAAAILLTSLQDHLDAAIDQTTGARHD